MDHNFRYDHLETQEVDPSIDCILFENVPNLIPCGALKTWNPDQDQLHRAKLITAPMKIK